MDEQLQFPGFDESTPNPDPTEAAKARHPAGGGRGRRRQLAEFPELMTVVEATEYLSVAVSTGYMLTKHGADPVSLTPGQLQSPTQR